MTVLEGKRVALVTGAAGGIGSATAAAFVRAGWQVVGVDIRGGELRASAEVLYQADLADESESRQVFSALAASHGRLDVLVNNAAIQLCKPLVETTPAEWDAVMAANVRAVYLAVRHGYELLRESKGAIVNVASVHAVATSANLAAYAASKGGLVALTRALAIELAPDGIRVNAVLPGAIETEMLRAGLGRGHLRASRVEDRVDELGRRHVIGRVGRPEEVAEAIVFLADHDRSSFITGEAMVVDGGALSRLSTE